MNPRQVSNLNEDAAEHTVMAVATNVGIQLFDARSDGGLRLRSGRRLDSPLTFTLSDVNSDGYPDLVTTLLDKDGFEVIMSRSSQFQQSEIVTAPESMRGFHVADWTGDGAVELLLEHVEGLSFLRNGESGWQTQQRLRVPNFTPAHLVELTGDGRLDIVGYQLRDRLKDVFTWRDDVERLHMPTEQPAVFSPFQRQPSTSTAMVTKT